MENAHSFAVWLGDDGSVSVKRYIARNLEFDSPQRFEASGGDRWEYWPMRPPIAHWRVFVMAPDAAIASERAIAMVRK